MFSCNNGSVCTIDQNNAGKQIYNLSEATCFIALKLKDNAPELELIQNALIIEEQYMTESGLIPDEPNSEDESSPTVIFYVEDLIEFALKNEDIGLTKGELSDIYDQEVEYLKFIGVVGN